MDDLTHYILNHYHNLLTVDEAAAHRSVIGEEKAANSDAPRMQAMLRCRWVSSDPQVQELLKDGKEQFMVNVRDRVLREQSGEMFLNYCPRCGALARTPQARQCPQCFHSWRDAC